LLTADGFRADDPAGVGDVFGRGGKLDRRGNVVKVQAAMPIGAMPASSPASRLTFAGSVT
jgi:hypothetical protein